MGKATVHKIVKEVCQVLWTVLSKEYLKPPSTTTEWYRIAENFEDRWQFPNCLGAIDGKHVNVKAPANSGSLYFNYKKDFSIVLMACCDANYTFTMVDIGGYGSAHDSTLFRDSVFGQALEDQSLLTPQGTSGGLPYVFVADEAFPLKQHIMRPYPGLNKLSNRQRIFNYRLSRARRCIESAFGILSARWRILLTTINADADNVDNIIKACVCLHNFIKINDSRNGYRYGSEGLTNETESHLQSVGRLSSNNATRPNYELRDKFADYFVSTEGSVPWQNKVLETGIKTLD